ncbi:MAG: 30S ribosomal protein S20 [Caldilineales bacterium]|nr:30S ribosomal protein S20 [Caldilineales bacterium]
MATHKSAIKRHRQSLKRRERNRVVRGGVRKAIKNTRVLVAAGEMDAAREAMQEAISHLDKAAEKGILHKNNAARRKSRLARLFNAASAPK